MAVAVEVGGGRRGGRGVTCSWRRTCASLTIARRSSIESATSAECSSIDLPCSSSCAGWPWPWPWPWPWWPWWPSPGWCAPCAAAEDDAAASPVNGGRHVTSSSTSPFASPCGVWPPSGSVTRRCSPGGIDARSTVATPIRSSMSKSDLMGAEAWAEVVWEEGRRCLG